MLKCFEMLHFYAGLGHIWGMLLWEGWLALIKTQTFCLPWNVFEFMNMPYLGILNREGIRTNLRRWRDIAAKCVVDSSVTCMFIIVANIKEYTM